MLAHKSSLPRLTGGSRKPAFGAAPNASVRKDEEKFDFLKEGAVERFGSQPRPIRCAEFP